MVNRLPALLRESEARGVKYGWVIILGGINDLGEQRGACVCWDVRVWMWACVSVHMCAFAKHKGGRG